MAILRRTERAMEKRRTEDLTEMLGLKETAVQMAKANGVRWYGHVLRRGDGHLLRKALEQEEARTTKEDVEDASGKGCHESSEMESGS